MRSSDVEQSTGRCAFVRWFENFKIQTEQILI